MAAVEFVVDARDVLASLKKLRSKVNVKVWADAILELARRQARARIGTGFGNDKVAESVRIDLRGPVGEVYTDDKIAVHVHQGGPIRSGNGRRLAIPLPTSSTERYNSGRHFARDVARSHPLFKLTSKKGNELLFPRPERGEELGPPLFVLKDQTRPQLPRPWWPTHEEAREETKRFFEEIF